jgi:hypothetical protein
MASSCTKECLGLCVSGQRTIIKTIIPGNGKNNLFYFKFKRREEYWTFGLKVKFGPK